MTDTTVTEARLREIAATAGLRSIIIPVAEGMEIITLALEALALRTPSEGEARLLKRLKIAQMEDGCASESVRLVLADAHAALASPSPQPVAEAVAWPGRKFCETAERNIAELAKFIKGEDDLRVVTDAGLAIRTLLASIDALASPPEGLGVEVKPLEGMDYILVHDAAQAAYEAATPDNYRYSAVALRKAVDAGLAAAAALQPKE